MQSTLKELYGAKICFFSNTAFTETENATNADFAYPVIEGNRYMGAIRLHLCKTLLCTVTHD